MAPDRGQSFYSTAKLAESDQLSVRRCSVERPCGDSDAMCLIGGSQRLRTSNISHNFVAASGACLSSTDADQLDFYYAMVSHNFGTTMFSLIHGLGEVKVSHCSLIHNSQVEGVGFFHLKELGLILDQCNFMENQFTKFVKGGRITIRTKIVTDFSLSGAVVEDCVLTNPEHAFKVLWVDAGMEYMETWGCWALGSSSPSASQSAPPFGQGSLADSGLFVFLVLSLVAGVPTAFGYMYWIREHPRDLSVLRDLPISNR
jgi:hypothetical protein